jgi:hypothetical protein
MVKEVGQGVWLYFLFSFCMHIYPLICLALPITYDNPDFGFLLKNTACEACEPELKLESRNMLSRSYRNTTVSYAETQT